MELEKIIEERVNKKLIELRLKNSLEILENVDIDLKLKEILKNMILKRLREDKEFYKTAQNINNIGNKQNKKLKAVVAFSGGVDSSCSLLIAKHIFDVEAVTCYSEYIMTDEMKENAKNIAKKIGVDLYFIDIDLDDIYKGVVEGRYHPCGRCHKVVEEAVINYAEKNHAKFVIFGDLMAFGYLSLYKYKNDLFRFNLPSFFALTKDEEREILKNNSIEVSSYTCPLLKIYHKHNKNYKFTIQRILREVRGRVISEEEGFKNIKKYL